MMMKKVFMKYAVYVGALVASIQPLIWADETIPTAVPEPELSIELGAPFRKDAILQRETKVPVWGWSKPGTKVTVKFAGQEKSTVAAGNGQGTDAAKWMVELDPLKASFEPAEMVVSESTGASVVLTNILVGEVWLASGQSNMNRPVNKTSVSKLGPPAKAELNPIRQCSVVDALPSLYPIERAKAAWNMDWITHNAISYAFARKLLEELDVPVGIIHCAVGETTIQTWTPRSGFAGGEDEYTKAIYRKILEGDPSTPEHKAVWDKFYRDVEDTMKRNKEQAARGEVPEPLPPRPSANLTSTRDATWMFNGKMNPMIPYAIRGAIWNQGYHSKHEGIVYYNNLHSMIRGWRKEWNRPELPVYFHQFYTPHQSFDCMESDTHPSIDPTSETRLGTWLARDIPNADMASQIDIGGNVHYYCKAVPGQRFARLALKNLYGKNIVAHGPMFKSYTVKGNQLIIEFEHVEGGLVVAETVSNAKAGNIEEPTVIENGDDQVKLFYLAGEDRIWHPANMKIDGERVIITSPAVPDPRGVSYASGGAAWLPNLYNRSLLPTTPFIYFDNELVTSKTWPGGHPLQIAGVKPNPELFGKLNDFRSLPLLSSQFRNDAVFQADVPVTIWGSVRANGIFQDQPEKGVCKVIFEFSPQIGSGQGEIRKTIDVTPEMREWQVVLPPMKAGNDSYTLKVSFTVDGEVVHERICKNIVFGNVFYVAAPGSGPQRKFAFVAPEPKPSGQIVRMMVNRSKRSSKEFPSRYSVSTSPKPDTDFSERWEDASGVPAALGHAIAAKTQTPVGIIYMEVKGGGNPPLKDWIAPESLDQATSLMDDYKQWASIRPGNGHYDANVSNYVADWKRYWSDYIPKIIKTKKLAMDAEWGDSFPSLKAEITTTASTTFYVSTLCYTPASLKGIIFLGYPELFGESGGANFGPEMTALANGWKARFGSPDPHFFYTVPSKALVPEYTIPKGIHGKNTAVEITQWNVLEPLVNRVAEEMQQ